MSPDYANGGAVAGQGSRPSWGIQVGAVESGWYRRGTTNNHQFAEQRSAAEQKDVRHHLIGLDEPIPQRPDKLKHFLPSQLLVLENEEMDMQALHEKVYHWTDPKVSKSWNCLVEDKSDTSSFSKETCLGYENSTKPEGVLDWDLMGTAHRWMYFPEPVHVKEGIPFMENLFFLKKPVPEDHVVHESGLANQCLAKSKGGEFEARACSTTDPSQHWSLGKGQTDEEIEKKLQLGARWWDVECKACVNPTAEGMKNQRLVLVQHLNYPENRQYA